ncbi:MAG: peptidoglycan editing factor PgeF [Thermodesulfobacteriota bacterium]|nr:peptidoglycan editing factor PgeF [Thermodesulfobacteriota bacterium]
MIEVKQGNLTYFRFEIFKPYPELVHGIFTRQGGVSPPPFNNLNMSTSQGDTSRNVTRNRNIMAESLGFKKTAFVHQVHGTTVLPLKTITDIQAANAIEADAMVTDQPDVLLCIKLADCQAVLLYDPARRVIANLHSGWRGSIADIIGKTVAVMKNAFDCDPARMIAGIGPSLGPCCAEFVHYKKEIPEPFWQYKDDKDRFDFWQISRDQLIGAGLPIDNIQTARICTKCRSDRFFSYRKEGKTGRFTAAIGLNPPTCNTI